MLSLLGSPAVTSVHDCTFDYIDLCQQSDVSVISASAHLLHSSGAISNCRLFFLSSLLDTFQPRGLIFQCHIFLPFHTVHGVLAAKILEWLAIPCFSGPRFVRILHYDLPVSGGPEAHGLQLH